ncbi:MAG: 50S ribosomal protein L33 [Candidatus Kapaibacteriota bacterium]|jgi:large subunit ribosomal protein L33
MAKKGHRIQITLECTEAKAEGRPASRYTTKKNKQNTPDRMEIKKYNPFLRRHTVHKEVK